MKKLIAMLLCICMMLGLVACGAPAAKDAAATEAPETVQAEQPAAEAEKNDDAVAESVPAETEPAEETVEATEETTEPTTGKDSSDDKEEEATKPTEEEKPAEVLPNGDYNEGIVLVKVKETFDEADLGELEYTSAEPLFAGSAWYAVVLADSTKTIEAVSYLTALGTFAQVDYDYVMATDTSVEGVDVSANPQYSEQQHHYTHKVPEGWAYTAANNKYPGGSSDVIVAVIDTGVDYHHLDLRNNIWTNTAEIPNNGIDDDENGYIDDVYGWDFVGEDNSPLDDNGHGTHVAGIIAAENNSIGGVGIAYNCKIMALKAGNSSGYFNNSDIAEAVQYAYMNGASVINMSFGGSSISFVVREALETAYTSCVLVAAAGNDGMCNNVSCKVCDLKGVMYPAAMTCVIGVMSTGGDGSTISSFSNYDHYPHNAVEYEVYAVGESIPSCWPGNKYAKLNGTSMATPTVAAIAALLRSYLPDRNVYSTKFLQSQIVNTGTLYPYNAVIEKTDDGHSVVTIYEALTQLPKPDVKLYDYTIDDRISLNNKVNNGNGVIDAGETVRLSIALQNKGGVASNVHVTINAEHNGLADPYFTFVNDTMELSDIGTYSVRESGTEKYFEIQVSPDCPNDYLIDFNICYTYTNGMDETDETVYTDDGRQQARFNVSRGWHLPAAIIQDTVFAADKLYILSQDMVIAEGVTVTFEAGTEIQFYDDREYFNSPAIKNYGTLNFNGTAGNMISIHPNERHSNYRCYVANYGTMHMDYVSSVNLTAMGLKATANTYVSNSDLYTNALVADVPYTYTYTEGQKDGGGSAYNLLGQYWTLGTTEYDNNYIEMTYWQGKLSGTKFTNNYIVLKSKIGSESKLTNAESNTLVLVEREDENNQQSQSIEFHGYARNNAICVPKEQLANAMVIDIKDKTQFTGNTFSKVYQENAAQLIKGYYDNTGSITVDVFGELENTWDMWPNIEKVEILNSEGELTNTVGKEAIVIRITFNRPMDVGADTYLTFGTKAPYGDYRIDGSYVDELIWEGTYSLKAQIENGQNFLKVNNAYAMADSRVKVFGDHQLHEFTIDTSAALSMNLMAIPAETGIRLTWAQDDYTTLLGYNIYRSEAKDGNYVKLNPTILLPTDESFIDENAEPGKTYWYTYTVVLSDFSESNPAGKVAATALDTMAPSLYHTPVNQGYEYNNLVISCTASDNVAIRNVTLFYRTTGGEWKELPMLQTNDKFSATIFGSEVSLAGIEYYIVASDDVNTVTKGSAAEPYCVVIKSADALLGKGDVDGDGTVTTKDALMLMQCLNDDLLLSDDEFKRADLNVDGILSAVEALRILQYVNGKITSLV